MAAILDGRENLEMSHRAKDLYCFFALFWSFFRHRFRHERTKGKQILFYFSPNLGRRLFLIYSRVFTSSNVLVSFIFSWIAFSMRLHIHEFIFYSLQINF